MITRQYAPFIHSEKNAPYIYLNVLVALIPCICLSVVYYGLKSLITILVSMLLFFFSDLVFAGLLKKKTNSEDYYDLSSLISGAVFALLLPGKTPLIVVIVGVLFASLVVKQLPGGVGTNIFNPAIAARMFVELIFPKEFMQFCQPLNDWFDITSLIYVPDGYSAIGNTTDIYFLEVITGRFATYTGIGCFILIAVSGVFLLLKGIVRGYAMFGYMFAVLVSYPILHYSTVFTHAGLRAFAVYICTSGVAFIAVFALGDFTTMPINSYMRLFLSGVCGVVTTFMYQFSDPITALCMPVLMINLMTPICDYLSGVLFRKAGKKKQGKGGHAL